MIKIINSEIKPLVANLTRINIGSFIVAAANNFDILLFEHNFDTLWEKSKQQIRKDNLLAFIGPNRFEDYEKAFMLILDFLWEKNKENFYNLLGITLKEFIIWDKGKTDLKTVIENLKNLNMPISDYMENQYINDIKENKSEIMNKNLLKAKLKEWKEQLYNSDANFFANDFFFFVQNFEQEIYFQNIINEIVQEYPLTEDELLEWKSQYSNDSTMYKNEKHRLSYLIHLYKYLYSNNKNPAHLGLSTLGSSSIKECKRIFLDRIITPIIDYLSKSINEEENSSTSSITSNSFSVNKMEVNPIFKERKFVNQNKNCFILMPFTEKWSDRLYKEIKKIVENNGFSCSRADDLYGQNILEDIWIAINESSCIIADITTKNPNVFYEIGIAHTLGKKVILLTQAVSDIPFDFKNYRLIIYEDNVDGFGKLNQELPKYL